MHRGILALYVIVEVKSFLETIDKMVIIYYLFRNISLNFYETYVESRTIIKEVTNN
jgi:hypothetical protein